MKSYHRYIILILVFLWLLGLLGYYFWVHKPISPTEAAGILAAIFRMAIAVGIVSICGGVGAFVFDDDDISLLVRLTVQFALGMGIVSVGILIIGSTVGLNRLMLWGMVLILGIVLRKKIIGWWKMWGALGAVSYRSNRFERLVLGAIFGILLFTLLISLAPPIKFDALVYHLALPKTYLDQGRISYFPWLMYWGMPQVTEMVNTWIMALGGERAAVVFCWMIGVISLVGIFGFIEQIFNKRTAWAALGAVISGFSAATSLAWGYVEWTTILFGFAVLFLVFRWLESEQVRHLLLAGAFAGFALGSKYTAGVIIISGLVVILWQRRNQPVSKIIGNLFAFGAVATFISFPWWVKNFVATGNPFYPFLFPAGAMDQIRIDMFQNQPPLGSWLDAVFLPIRATIFGNEGVTGFGFAIGPLLLGLGTFFWVGFSKRVANQQKLISIALITSIVGTVIWAVATLRSELLIQTRLYLVLLPGFAFLAASGFDAVRQIKISEVRLGRVVEAMILFVLWLNIFQVGMTTFRQGAIQNVLSIKPDKAYLADNLGWFAEVSNSIRELPDETKVLMLWEPRAYYCYPKCEPDETLDLWKHDLVVYESTKGVIENWRVSGFTHLLVYDLGAEYVRENNTHHYDPADWNLFDQMISDLESVTDFGGAYTLYSLAMP